jgi:hypothetical protein
MPPQIAQLLSAVLSGVALAKTEASAKSEALAKADVFVAKLFYEIRTKNFL